MEQQDQFFHLGSKHFQLILSASSAVELDIVEAESQAIGRDARLVPDNMAQI
jgi:hypothetical protein